MKKTTETSSKDVLTQYFSDISGTKILSPSEEIEAFRRIETAEQKYVCILLRDRSFWRNSLHLLQKMATEMEEWTDEYAGCLKSVESSSPSKKSLHAFIRAVRFSDSGRAWMRVAFIRSQDPDRIESRRLWAKQVEKAWEVIQEAKNSCIAANLRLVISTARRYVKPGSSQSITDLIQEGNIGLMKAVDRFDTERGFKFATYATWWIRHHIRRTLDEKESIVRIPIHVGEDAKKVSRAESMYLTQHGKLPSEEELGKMLKLSAKKVENALMNKLKTNLSLDVSVGEEESDMMWVDYIEDQNVVSPIETLALAELKGSIHELLKHITSQERDILRWRFGFDGGEELTLQEIGEKYDLSRERIRQLENQAIRKMKMHADKNRNKFNH